MSSSVICFLSRITQGTSFAGIIQHDRIISCSRKKHKNLKGAEGIKLQRKSASFLCGAITDPFFCHSKHARACPSMLRYTREYPSILKHTREGNTKPIQSKPRPIQSIPIQFKPIQGVYTVSDDTVCRSGASPTPPAEHKTDRERMFFTLSARRTRMRCTRFEALAMSFTLPSRSARSESR